MLVRALGELLMKGRESAGAAESWAESDTAVLCRESGDWREVEESEIVLFFNESGIVLGG